MYLSTKRNIFIILFIFAIFATIIFVFAPTSGASADWISDPLGTVGGSLKETGFGDLDIPTLIGTAVNIILTIAQVAFVVLFLVGGLMYLTSAGNEDTSGKARKLLIDAVIGIVIVFAAWGVSTWLLNSLKGASSDSSSGTDITSAPTSIPTDDPGEVN